jgi:hypothetical protein
VQVTPLLKRSTPTCGRCRGTTQRIQRYPQYSDSELEPFFLEVSAGYCFKQAAHRCGYPWERLNNTLLSDDEVMFHALDLSIAAGAEIRAGHKAVPARWDGLYSP